jgi:hypothetical protein
MADLNNKRGDTMGAAQENAERGSVEIELKGKSYTLLALDLKEMGLIENFIKSKYARLYRDSAQGVDPKEREEQVIEILMKSYTPEELAVEMDAGDCLLYIVWLMLQDNEGVTYENITDIVDQNNIKIVTTAMKSFADDSEDDDAENPQIAAAKAP